MGSRAILGKSHIRASNRTQHFGRQAHSLVAVMTVTAYPVCRKISQFNFSLFTFL
jgi:hypothetical protein